MDDSDNGSNKKLGSQSFGSRSNGGVQNNSRFQRKIAISSFDDGSGSDGFECYWDM